MVKIFDSENKYKTILVILLILFVSIIAISITISNVDFEEKPEGTIATVVNEGDLVINYNDGEIISFNDSQEHSYKISITNNSSNKIYYSIYIVDANLEILDVKVKDKDGNVVSKTKNIKEEILNLYSIPGNETVRYTILLKNTKRVRFNGTLKVVNESMTTEMFSDLLLFNNSVSVNKTRIGSDVATTNEGLIESYDNDGKTYYFRGDVKNNYFKINNMLFRIVRINGDNSVRLVLDDVISTKYAYNNNVIDTSKSVSNYALLSNSSVLNELNNWFNTYLGVYKSYFTKGSYCTDTTFNLVNNNISYSSTYERIFNDEAPDLYCSGTIFKSYVGLLNVDEIVFAGASGTKPNNSYYLYNNKISGNYLTTSSYSINAANNVVMMNVMSNGAIGDGILINESSYIRPVVNIGINAKIKGEGTLENPYIIVS